MSRPIDRRTFLRRATVAAGALLTARRTKLSRELGQKLYDGYHGVMLGMKAITWAVSKKVSAWQTLAYTPAETNYETVS